MGRSQSCAAPFQLFLYGESCTGHRQERANTTRQIRSGENFPRRAHLLGIGPSPKPQEVTTRLNLWFVLVYSKTLTTVTLEIFRSLHFLDILQCNRFPRGLRQSVNIYKGNSYLKISLRASPLSSFNPRAAGLAPG